MLTDEQKEKLFISWLTGKNAIFPFMKDLPEVPIPTNYKEHPNPDLAYEAQRDLEDEETYREQIEDEIYKTND